MQRIECKIIGKVQGVFFRDFTNQNARALGLVGTVCNLPDGSVFVVAEGEKAKLQKLLVLLEKGTPHSKVENMETKWSLATGEFLGFQIIL